MPHTSWHGTEAQHERFHTRLFAMMSIIYAVEEHPSTHSGGRRALDEQCTTFSSWTHRTRCSNEEPPQRSARERKQLGARATQYVDDDSDSSQA